MTYLKKIFLFFSSLKLAITILFLWAVTLTVATVLESAHDAETAKHYVYGHIYFYFLMLLLGINVTCAAFSRLPWKRHHIGFLITHLGIVTLLIGSFITLYMGYEGQIALEEGESSQWITLSEPVLHYYDHSNSQSRSFPVNYRYERIDQGTPKRLLLSEDDNILVHEYLYSAKELVTVKNNAEHFSPALEFLISGSRAQIQKWIFAKDQSIRLGPAEISFFVVQDESEIAAQTAKQTNPNLRNQLILFLLKSSQNKLWMQVKSAGQWGKAKPIDLNQAYPVNWMDFKFTVIRKLDRAVKSVKYRLFTPIDATQALPPAALLSLTVDGKELSPFWLAMGDAKTLFIKGRKVSLFFRYKTRTLGFWLKLDKFVVDTQEGSDAPAAFTSYVSVKDKDGNQTKSKIFMNNPLETKLFKIFQASFQDLPDGSKISVFQVAYDPGIWVKYIGSIIMILGIVLMFYFKPLFLQNRNKKTQVIR